MWAIWGSVMWFLGSGSGSELCGQYGGIVCCIWGVGIVLSCVGDLGELYVVYGTWFWVCFTIYICEIFRE